MPRRYEVFISKAAFDYLDTLEYWDRVRILDFLERLRQQPFRAGDFSERGPHGRDWEGAILGPAAVLWWVDDPVSVVMVVAARPADA